MLVIVPTVFLHIHSPAGATQTCTFQMEPGIALVTCKHVIPTVWPTTSTEDINVNIM